MNALNAVQTYENPDENVYAAYITTKDGELVLADAFVEGEGGEETHIPAKPPELLYIDENGKLQINSQVKQNPYYIAAARIDLDDYAPGEDWTKSIGNSTNAGFMTAIKDEKICSYGSPNDSTLSQFLINTAAKNGMDLAAMENKAELYQGIADANEEEYSNAIGVNLDEELADMIKYQRAYEASAAIFSAANNMMQIIMGLV
jgi:flagellar hook-associated protein FlgK